MRSSRCWRLPEALLALTLAGCSTAAAPAPPRAADPPPFIHARATAAAPHGGRLTARLRHAVRLRAAPGGRILARLGARTEFGSPKALGVRRRRGAWLQVMAPELRNGRYGWIPARAVRLGATDIEIRVDRSAHRLTVRRGGRVVRRFPVAVGWPGNPTPLGRFAITDRLRTHRADSPYGCCALALSGHQPHLPAGWPGGDRIAIHATPATATIGHSASLGCLRAATADVRALMRLVPLGAPVLITR